MSIAIRIRCNELQLAAELNESTTARAIADVLPVEGVVSTWGEEVYFSIPIDAEMDMDARAEMAIGELAFWPPGNAFCIFFGATPASTSDEPAAASPCNPVGHITDDITPLFDIRSGAVIRLEQG